MLLSAGLMLHWLGERHGVAACVDAADRLERAIEAGFRAKTVRPIEQGGAQTTTEVARAVIGML
jgi:3-isopropylmalate dehydrogenase